MSKTSNMMNYMAEKAVICEENCRIDYKLYDEYGVKKGLRDKNGMGVLAGITNISHIQAYDTNENGEKVPCDGKLLYRGYNVNDLVRGFVEEKRFGFEETTWSAAKFAGAAGIYRNFGAAAHLTNQLYP